MLPLASLLLRDRSGRCRCFNVVAYCCIHGKKTNKTKLCIGNNLKWLWFSLLHSVWNPKGCFLSCGFHIHEGTIGENSSKLKPWQRFGCWWCFENNGSTEIHCCRITRPNKSTGRKRSSLVWLINHEPCFLCICVVIICVRFSCSRVCWQSSNFIFGKQ